MAKEARHGRTGRGLRAIRERYAESGRSVKGMILDEFVALTGLHRKHAIRILGAGPEKWRPRGRMKSRYGSAVKDALGLLWEASGPAARNG